MKNRKSIKINGAVTGQETFDGCPGGLRCVHTSPQVDQQGPHIEEEGPPGPYFSAGRLRAESQQYHENNLTPNPYP